MEIPSEGVLNPEADKVERINETWSDTEFDDKHFSQPFKRLECQKCQGTSFEVLDDGRWHTIARCNGCGMYYIVHSG